MDLKKSYINIDELLILAKMNKSFSICGFKTYEFLDILYRNNVYYCVFISEDNSATNFEFYNYNELKDTLSKRLRNIYFDRTALRIWKKNNS